MYLLSLIIPAITLIFSRTTIATPRPSILTLPISNTTTTTTTNFTLNADPETWPLLNAAFHLPRNLQIRVRAYSPPPPRTSKLAIIEALFYIDHKIQEEPAGAFPNQKSFTSGPVTVSFLPIFGTQKLQPVTKAQAAAVLYMLERLTVFDGVRGVQQADVMVGDEEAYSTFSLWLAGVVA